MSYTSLVMQLHDFSSHVSILITFLFHRDDGLLDVPSFPTRRSSDLGGRRRARDRAPRRPRARLALASGLHRPAVSGDGHQGDRKSTRLNSSHVEISYAVFCLKKKNPNDALNLAVFESLRVCVACTVA